MIFDPFRIVTQNFDLFKQALKREVVQKYKGSYLGMLWNFIHPLVILFVYTFVFGLIFKSKWEIQVSDSNAEFAITLFVGITLYSFFSDVINRSPSLVINNVNYVKKVIFPLELLSIVNVFSLLIPVLFNLIIIVVSKFVFMKIFDLSFLLFPIILLPLFFIVLGISWLLSALGVFIRDIQQISSIITLIMGYLTPVFYPLSFVPEKLRFIMYLNPLTFIVDSARKILIYGIQIDWGQYFVVLVLSYIIMILGFNFFEKLKNSFADVM